MPEVTLNGCKIVYEERGAGIPVVLTPGGRWGGYVQRVVAEKLAAHYRVITWDRRNCDGESDIIIKGDDSEADVWCEDLAALIRHLKIGPCYLGEYAGCRTSPLVCIKYADLVKGLLLAWPSGGPYPAARLPTNIYQPYNRAAIRRGMEGVVETSHFATCIKKAPANRERLLRMDRREFQRQMGFWEAYFTTSGDLPIAGSRLSADEWASIKVPATVTGGCDPTHPTATAQLLHKLLSNSSYHDPVVTEQEWTDIFGKGHYPTTSDFQGERIAPVWLAFLKEQEGR